MSSSQKPLTNKQVLMLLALYALHRVGRFSVPSGNMYFTGRAISELAYIDWSHHSYKLMDDLCAKGWVDRQVHKNIFVYALTNEGMAVFDGNCQLALTERVVLGDSLKWL